MFLRLNGFALTAAQSDAALVMLDLAGGVIGEQEFAEWLKRNVREMTP